jgi:hypothetical protein
MLAGAVIIALDLTVPAGSAALGWSRSCWWRWDS